MTLILKPGRWRRQPEHLAGVDWQHPITYGLVGAWIANKNAPLWNAAQPSRLNLTATGASRFNTERGLAIDFSGSDQYLQNTSQTVATDVPLSFFVFCFADSWSADNRIFQVSTGTTSNDVIGLAKAATGIYAQHYDGATNAVTGSYAQATGTWFSAAAVMYSLSSRALFADGRLRFPNSTTVSAPSGIDRISLGWAPWASSQYFNGRMLCPLLFKRALKADEIEELHINPWQIFESDLHRTFHFIPAAGGATVTPDKADLTLTGYAPTATRTTNVYLIPGSSGLTLTTYAPTVTVSSGVTITPGKADFSLTGYAPVVTRTTNVYQTPGKADLTLTGYAPSVTVTSGATLTPGKADLTLTGHAPTVSKTEHVIVNPTTGALVITGYAPTITVTGDLISRTYRKRGRRIDWPDLEELRRLEEKKEGIAERIVEAEGELAYAMNQKVINRLSSRITTLQRNLDSLNERIAELEAREMEDVAMIVSILDDSIYD